MRRLTVLTTLIVFLCLALANNVALGQAPPAPVVRHLFRTEGLPLSGPFDVAHQTLLLTPGASTPWHTHPGLVFVTVLEGENTFRVEGTEKVYKRGDSFTEMPGHVVQAHNASATNTMVFASYVLPDGAPLSVPQPDDTTPPPRPSPGYQFRTDGLPVPAAYDVAHQVLDFAPGAATPWHTHPGQVLVTVLEGRLTFRVKGTETVYTAGDSFIELPNEVAQAANTTETRTTVMATFLVPRGAPLSHAVETPAPAPAPAAPAPPALPATGGPVPEPAALPDTGTDSWHLPVLVLATALLLGGIAARRQDRRGHG